MAKYSTDLKGPLERAVLAAAKKRGLIPSRVVTTAVAGGVVSAKNEAAHQEEMHVRATVERTAASLKRFFEKARDRWL